MRNCVVILLSIFILMGCNTDAPPLDVETYTQIRAELEIIHSIHTYAGNTENTALMLDELRAHYSFTDADFLMSYRYYEAQLVDEIARYERISQELDDEHRRLSDVLNELRRAEEILESPERGTEIEFEAEEF